MRYSADKFNKMKVLLLYAQPSEEIIRYVFNFLIENLS